MRHIFKVTQETIAEETNQLANNKEISNSNKLEILKGYTDDNMLSVLLDIRDLLVSINGRVENLEV